MHEFLTKLFSSDFMSHGYCYLWRPEIIWLHAISDSIIALSYYVIPLTLVYFVRKRRDLPFHWMFLMFGIFIFSCGTTHLMEVWTLWHGTYRLAGVLKAITAVASVATAALFVRLVPEAVALPSPAQLRAANQDLEREIQERRRVEQALQQAYNEVEDMVQARTAELVRTNEQLQAEIVERKRAEEALQRSEAYLTQAQRLTHTGSWAYRDGGRAVYWSEENFRIWGFDPQQGPMDLQKVLQQIHPEDRERVREHTDSAAQAKSDFAHEFRIVLPGGVVRHIHAVGHPVFNARGEPVEVVGTHVDVTERKRAEQERERLRELEAELAHINRVSMMGELAGSLGHEIKQPIAAAVTNANTCLLWLKRDHPDLEEVRDAASRMIEDAMRAAEIIDRMKSLYKKATPQREMVNVNEVIKEIIALLRNEGARYGISIRSELAPAVPNVMGDRVQLQQVLMNLMINGMDAMKGIHGVREITISSKSGGNDELLVAVSDTGVGLPPDAKQIFNAFFTTKAHGTGMGLAISRTIIESHGGRLSAAANAGSGAVFYFTLPAAGGVRA